MRILLVTVAYPPEVRSASYLMYELACELRDRGNEVTVLTTAPQYNIPKGYKDIPRKKVSIEEEIRIIRAKSLPVHKTGFILRGIGVLTLPIYLFRLAKKHIQLVDIVIVYSPPLTLAILGAWMKSKFKCKFILNVQDIFPQNAIDLRIMRNPVVIYFFEAIERFSYDYADHITVHSEGNLNFLAKRKKVKKEKISVLPNWLDTDSFESAKRTGVYKHKYKLNGKFVILFAGVVGPAQGLDIVIPIAEALRDIPDIVFLIVGDGTERAKIESEAQRINLKNILFSGFVPMEEYPFLAKDMDVGLVCLSKEMKSPVVPGKIQGYMAAGLPIIGILNKESDGHKFIRDAGAGFSLIAGDVKSSVEAIRKLYSDERLRIKMGAAGSFFVNSNLTKSMCVDSLSNLFNKVF